MIVWLVMVDVEQLASANYVYKIQAQHWLSSDYNTKEAPSSTTKDRIRAISQTLLNLQSKGPSRRVMHRT